jgi:hypothetical protein
MEATIATTLRRTTQPAVEDAGAGWDLLPPLGGRGRVLGSTDR